MRLTTRISLVLFVVVLVTAGTITALIFWQLDKSLVDSKIIELQRETAVQSTYFLDQINELTRDTQVIAGTPPVQGINRALANNGIDPLDQTPLEVWQQRLTAIVSAMLEYKPNYLQIRYIGVAENGRELIRVDRGGAGSTMRQVAQTGLQEKGDEPYFEQTLARPHGSVYLSSINLNREFGAIQEPRVPVIRSSVAVRSEQGEVVGIIIINFRMNEVFQRLANVANPDHAYFITNANGHYLHHARDQHEFDFETGSPHPATEDFPLLRQLMQSNGTQNGGAFAQSDRVIGVRRVAFGPPDLNKAIYLIATDNFADITTVSTQTLQRIGVALALLSLLAAIIGIGLARRIIWPITALTASVRDMDIRKATIDIPGPLPGEAGELADAFEESVEALHRRSEDLAASNRELQQFAYIASHDLQEPVRTVNSFSRLLADGYADKLDERGQKFIAFITQSSERMRELIFGLLEYSRLGTKSQPEQVNLNEVLQDIRADMSSTIEEASATLAVDTLPELRLYRLEIRLLFQNLIGNAIKYRHPERNPVIQLRCRTTPGGRVFEVEDNGLGIAPEHRDRVFLIFQRLHARNEYEGTGIGLAHCRKIVELHHGRIWIESAPGPGTIVKFEIKEVDRDE